jgi:hypothetical protein
VVNVFDVRFIGHVLVTSIDIYMYMVTSAGLLNYVTLRTGETIGLLTDRTIGKINCKIYTSLNG